MYHRTKVFHSKYQNNTRVLHLGQIHSEKQEKPKKMHFIDKKIPFFGRNMLTKRVFHRKNNASLNQLTIFIL